MAALPNRQITLAEAITFTRASKAWYFDSAGVFQEAAVDAIREDHDPGDSNARQGIALEGASTNLLLHSEDLGNAAWKKSGATIGTATTFATNISLDEIVEDTSTGGHVAFQQKSVSASGKVTASAHFKRNGTDRRYGYIRVQGYNSAGTIGRYSVLVDLDNGSVVDTNIEGATDVTDGARSDVVSLGGGVYRVEATVTNNITTTNLIDVLAGLSNTATPTWTSSSIVTYTGSTSESMYIGALQLEELPFASSYIPTTTAQVTRAAEKAEIADLAPWYRAGAYGLIAEAKKRGNKGSGTETVFSLSDDSFDNLVTFDDRGSSSPRLTVASGGVTEANITSSVIADRTTYRIAVRIKQNDVSLSVDGAVASTDTSASLPPPATKARLGGDATGGVTFYGWLRDFQYVTDPVLIASDYDDAGLALRSAEYA